MTDWQIMVGDVREQLALLPEKHFHCCTTSPPYWGLRDYGVAGQLGLEKTPQEYVANMIDVFAGVWRVLRDDGTLWLNIGDSYCTVPHGPKGTNSHDPKFGNGRQRKGDQCNRQAIAGLKHKDLVGIPWLLAFALRDFGWHLRMDIIWAKSNPMCESVRDRPTKSHEYIFLLTKKPRYYYDAIGSCEPCVSNKRKPGARKARPSDEKGGNQGNGEIPNSNPTRNKRSVWRIATHSFKGAHFATFPPKLVEPCIFAGTSERGCCDACGAPQARVVEKMRRPTRPAHESKVYVDPEGSPYERHNGTIVGNRDPERHCTETVTTGWRPSCKCGAETIPCRVLDPFAGAGTVGVVCLQYGRDFTGIELNPQYAEMARKRIQSTQPEMFG